MQFLSLKNYANSKGIKLIGDMPIYVAYDSSDVWSDQKNWLLDEDLNPRVVAGVPPDAFSETGQLWGNPIYNYEEMKKDGYDWWLKRIEISFRYFDYVRIDHFRGFESFWEIPFGDKDARGGRWVKGPDYELFQNIKNKFGKLNIIAEDLGYITPEVASLLEKCDFPGMEILEFGFDPYGDSRYAPHNHVSNCVCYPGTHDNETLKQWFSNLNNDVLSYVLDYLGIDDINKGPISMIRACLASKSDYAIIMYSDWLELDKEARFNEPNTASGNWIYRFTKDDFNDEIKNKILHLTHLYRRDI